MGFNHQYNKKQMENSEKVNCEVKARTETQLPDTPAVPVVNPDLTGAFIKIPLVLAEPTLRVIEEADIPLDPPAVEIKRVLKDVFLTQCKLVPVGPFTEINDTGFFTSEEAVLFIEGFIRKNIEYATKDCNAALRTITAEIPFSEDIELSIEDGLLNLPIFGFGEAQRAQFIEPKFGESPRLDKFFFRNSAIYNEQPFCELVSANFFEIDFAPRNEKSYKNKFKAFDNLREKIVADITFKVLQVQQIPLNGA
ncbi:MAG: CsxC family protein [Bacillota bacterium]